MILEFLFCVFATLGLFVAWHVFVGFVRFVDAIVIHYQYQRKGD